MTEQEFEHIAQTYRGSLKALARRFLRAADTAMDEDDVIQEALVAFWCLSEKGYPVRNVEAMLVKITKNICISNYRRRRAKAESVAADVFPGGYSATESVDRQDAERLRERLYSKLTVSEQAVTSIREETGGSLDDLAAKTGKDKSVVKVLLSKARRKMMAILKEQ